MVVAGTMGEEGREGWSSEDTKKTKSFKISFIRYCKRAYWALKLIRRTATEYMYVLGTVSSALSCLLPRLPILQH